MPERAYTVQEVGDLRQAVEDKQLYGWYNGPTTSSGTSRSYNAAELAKTVEERVRTRMLAGHTADDLRASEPNHKREMMTLKWPAVEAWA